MIPNIISDDLERFVKRISPYGTVISVFALAFSETPQGRIIFFAATVAWYIVYLVAQEQGVFG